MLNQDLRYEKVMLGVELSKVWRCGLGMSCCQDRVAVKFSFWLSKFWKEWVNEEKCFFLFSIIGDPLGTELGHSKRLNRNQIFVPGSLGLEL